MSKTLSNIVIGTTLFLIVGSVGWYLYSNYSALFFAEPVVDVPDASTVLQLPGSLILTLMPSIPLNSPAGIYAVSPKTGATKKIEDTNSYFAPSFSTNNFMAVTTATGSSSLQLMIVNVNDREHPIFFTPPAPLLFPGSSSWSPDNKFVVYEAVTALPTVGDVDIAHSRIVLLDATTGKQTILDVGASPVFSQDGSIVYLKSDGIYHVPSTVFAAGTSTQDKARVVWFDGYQATRDSHIAISHDGKTLLATHPHINSMIGYHINTTGEFTLTQTAGINTYALFPVFSPNDTDVAFIELNKDAEGIITKNLSIVNVVTLQKHILMDLVPYTNNFLSLSAWVK